MTLQSEIVNFANKYFNKPATEIAKLPESNQEEIKQNTSQDKTPPKIIIAKTLTFKNSSYKREKNLFLVCPQNERS